MRGRSIAAAALAVLLLGAPTDARAGLVDLGDLGTVIGGPVWQQFQQALFFDQAAKGTFNTPGGPVLYNGWVSQYGVLDGGQYFHTDLFTRPTASTADIWWNFTGSDYWMTYVLTYGVNETMGIYEERLFRVPYGEAFQARHSIALATGLELRSISFYGTDPAHVPEGGTRPMLAMGVALLTLRAVRFSRRHASQVP